VVICAAAAGVAINRRRKRHQTAARVPFAARAALSTELTKGAISRR